MNCPEAADTMHDRPARDRADLFLRPAAGLRDAADRVMIRMEDAGPLKKRLFDTFMAHARKVGPAHPRRQARGLRDRLKYALGEVLVYGPLKNTHGLDPGPRRLYGGRGDRAGDLRFLPLARDQPQAALRPDRGVGLHHRSSPTARCARTPWACPPRGRAADRRERRGVLPLARAPSSNTTRTPKCTASTKDAEGWVATGDAGFIEEGTGHLRIIDRAKDVGKMADGSLFAPKYVENKLKFYPNILEAVVFGAGRDDCLRLHQHRPHRGRQLGRAQQHRLCLLPGTGAASAGAGHRSRRHVEEVNESVAQDEMLSGCQVHRFLCCTRSWTPMTAS